MNAYHAVMKATVTTVMNISEAKMYKFNVQRRQILFSIFFETDVCVIAYL